MPVTVRHDPLIFLLETSQDALCLAPSEDGRLLEHYRGPRMRGVEDHHAPGRPLWLAPPGNQESLDNMAPWFFPVREGAFYRESCLDVEFADGTRDVRLRLVRHEVEADRLNLLLADPKGLEVELRLRVFEDEDLFEHRTLVRNTGADSLVVLSALTAAMHAPPEGPLEILHLAGQWLAEFQRQRVPLSAGRKVLESRRGITSHQANPFWALVRPETGEDHGEAWFGLVACSGNWKIAVDRVPSGPTVVTAGRGDHDARQMLAPGGVLELPPVVTGCTRSGLGDMSRRLHQFQRRHILPGGGGPRPVLYNSWEATTFDLRDDHQTALAEKAASVGVELFVLDDGWFGGRRHDRAGLGDWWVSRDIFPHGLKPLADTVRRLGMRFGLWFEPEMVNPDSDLFRAHPDWIYAFPGRETTLLRHQAVLNFARSDVREHVLDCMLEVICEVGVTFIKWDMNRPITEAGWSGAPAGLERSLWQAHAAGVHEVMDRLRREVPGLELESCASGGGRVDLAMLARVEQVWTSDNTDAWDRLFIQDGFTLAYAPKTMMGWVTHSPNWATARSSSRRFRFLCAMCGGLGIGEALDQLTPEELAECADWIAIYKSLRATIQDGDLYRIRPPGLAGPCVVGYVAPDRSEAVVFVLWPMRRWSDAAVDVPVPGLDPARRYVCTQLDRPGAVLDSVNHGCRRSGEAWRNLGLRVDLRGDDACAVYRLAAQ